MAGNAGTAVLDPTETEAIRKESESAVATIEGLKVTNEITNTEAGDALKRIKRVKDRIVDWISPTKKSARATYEGLRQMEKDLLSIPERAERHVRGEMEGYADVRRKAQQEKMRKEQARLQAEADERREKELAELAKKRDAESKRRKKELEETPVVVDAVPEKELMKTSAAGVSNRQIWQFDVQSKSTLVQAAAKDPKLLDYLKVDEAAVGKIVRAARGKIEIPGIHAYPKEVVSART